jgi:ribonuclease D
MDLPSLPARSASGGTVRPGRRSALVASESELRALRAEVAHSARVAVDLEASGMFAYCARICTVQIAAEGTFAAIDALSVPLESLRDLLGERGPVKIVHDVAFDARLLAESSIELGNVHDTALAAHMLGRTGTGLAALLASELGVHIEKGLQQHDWRVRPIDDAMLSYLASDVVHLEDLERVLWDEVTAKGIVCEVLEETRYRLASAISAAGKPPEQPPYLRVRGAGHLAERELAVLRVVADLREREALDRDVPPYKVVPNEALIAIARTRPTTSSEIGRIRGISLSTPAARAFASKLAVAVASAGEVLPELDRARLERMRTAPVDSRLRRERETHLVSWRRAEAKRRAVDEQVVLPGHCLKDAAAADAANLDDLRRVPGIGEFRIERDGGAILNALRGDKSGG